MNKEQQFILVSLLQIVINGNLLEKQNTDKNFMEYAHAKFDSMGVFYYSNIDKQIVISMTLILIIKIMLAALLIYVITF